MSLRPAWLQAIWQMMVRIEDRRDEKRRVDGSRNQESHGWIRIQDCQTRRQPQDHVSSLVEEKGAVGAAQIPLTFLMMTVRSVKRFKRTNSWSKIIIFSNGKKLCTRTSSRYEIKCWDLNKDNQVCVFSIAMKCTFSAKMNALRWSRTKPPSVRHYKNAWRRVVRGMNDNNITAVKCMSIKFIDFWTPASFLTVRYYLNGTWRFGFVVCPRAF